MPEYTHLHVHTKYSLLDGASQVQGLMKKAKDNGMKAIAITDHGNMLGVPEFISEARNSGLLPIIGCELYLAPRSRFDRTKSEGEDERNFYHQLILARNTAGYRNLSKLCSLGFIEGFYYRPRVDRELIIKYKEGLIATTSCIAGEINRAIISKGEEEAEKIFRQWLDIFGEDFYIELQRHGIQEQNICNAVLLKWSKKYNVKVIATNDVHYIDMQDAEAQDILLCIQTNKDIDDPKRMRFSGQEFFLKTKEEMNAVFHDLPEALDNTGEVVSKIEPISIERKILLPVFAIPPGYTDNDEYLRYLTLRGARERYREMTDTVLERIDFELSEIKKTGYAGYFLIVQDLIAAARKMGVWVGPGRGSAAGSIVAYTTGITNIDPIAYNLLFERFLTSERVSMPDIDIDFDDKGREKVIRYVVDKYGKERVAQIVTVGTMAAKMAVKDVARTLKVPLQDADRLTKLIPWGAKNLADAIAQTKELSAILNEKNTPLSRTLELATILDGTARQTGIHAAGIIIAPDDLKEYLPLLTSKDSELLVTQYEGNYVEKVGMLKMDFLGLRTLSILKDAIGIVEKKRGIVIEIDKIPLDDKKTFQLFQHGDMVGVFQFESSGMQRYLKELKPTSIEDLIAMNALYRPGPMNDIPLYIARKNGKEKPYYYHPLAEEILNPTYGVLVYQEQVMLISQQMAGFTKGQADILRKAMGKKDNDLLQKQKESFVRGSVERGVPEKTAIELFDKMAKFGGYGFNRAHSVAYALVAYQTAYLKANYTAEFMASVLGSSIGDIEKLTFNMDECRKMELIVSAPDINKGEYGFTVVSEKEISFGLGAVKGVGETAINSIVQERETNGKFKDVYDLMSRVNLRNANKKTFESLILAGAFDSLGSIQRAQYFAQENGKVSFLEGLIRYGNACKNGEKVGQNSLFGETGDNSFTKPLPLSIAPWNKSEQMNREKEVAGFYISGHPLDDFKFEIEHFCTQSLDKFEDLEKLKNKEVHVAGMVVSSAHRISGTGKSYGKFKVEDFKGSYEFMLFSEDYLKYKHLIEQGSFLFIKGRVGNRFNSEQLEVKVMTITLLNEIRDKMAKSITLNVPVNTLDETLIMQIAGIKSATAGNCFFSINLIDPEEKLNVTLRSKKTRLNLTNDLIRRIEGLSGISYKLN